MATQQKQARREAREAVFCLLYETEYHDGENPQAILTRAMEERELHDESGYLSDTYLGVMSHLDEVDELIGRHAKGWRTGRLSRVSRAILRLGAYELAFSDGVPQTVAINEAVELSKKFDDVRARAFINGVLNAIKDDLTSKNGETAENSASAARDSSVGESPYAGTTADTGSADKQNDGNTENTGNTENIGEPDHVGT